MRKGNFCYRTINTIRTSDAKLWFMKLQRDGRGYSTITSIRGVVKPAFQMACDEDIIRKNPFDFPLPTITPHILRHTFCTNMANAGMNLKSLQYLMGHSDAGITMNVYTHASYDHAAQSMQKILQFKKPEAERRTS